MSLYAYEHVLKLKSCRKPTGKCERAGGGEKVKVAQEKLLLNMYFPSNAKSQKQIREHTVHKLIRPRKNATVIDKQKLYVTLAMQI